MPRVHTVQGPSTHCTGLTRATSARMGDLGRIIFFFLFSFFLAQMSDAWFYCLAQVPSILKSPDLNS